MDETLSRRRSTRRASPVLPVPAATSWVRIQFQHSNNSHRHVTVQQTSFCLNLMLSHSRYRPHLGITRDRVREVVVLLRLFVFIWVAAATFLSLGMYDVCVRSLLLLEPAGHQQHLAPPPVGGGLALSFYMDTLLSVKNCSSGRELFSLSCSSTVK